MLRQKRSLAERQKADAHMPAPSDPLKTLTGRSSSTRAAAHGLRGGGAIRLTRYPHAQPARSLFEGRLAALQYLADTLPDDGVL